MRQTLRVSNLGHTWIFDLDGTIVKHNGYKLDGQDSFLPGAKKYIQSIPPKDMIIILTSRSDDVKEATESFLKENDIRYDRIVFNVPYGERILVNDDKPSGLCMSYAIRTKRDGPWRVSIDEDESI